MVQLEGRRFKTKMKKLTEIIFKFLTSHKIDALQADLIKLKKQ